MGAAGKHIVFDWNCTLFDDFQAMHACMNIIMENVGREPVSAEFFRTHYEVPFQNLYRNFGFGEHEIGRLAALDKDMFHRHYEPLAAQAPLRAGAAEILDHARAGGVAALILSNHIVEPIRLQLKRLAVDHLIDEILAYADHATQFVDMTKGERLRRFLAARKLAPDDIMIVGDSVEEIEIAREQGLVGIAITGGCVTEARLRAAQPDHLIHSLFELKPIMQERGFAS